jgi:hypothetical protein
VAPDTFAESLDSSVAGRPHHDDLVAGMLVEVRREGSLERRRLVVVDRPPVRPESVPEVAHRAEKQCELLRVVGVSAGELGGLDHQGALPGPASQWPVTHQQLVAQRQHCHRRSYDTPSTSTPPQRTLGLPDTRIAAPLNGTVTPSRATVPHPDGLPSFALLISARPFCQTVYD